MKVSYDEPFDALEIFFQAEPSLAAESPPRDESCAPFSAPCGCGCKDPKAYLRPPVVRFDDSNTKDYQDTRADSDFKSSYDSYGGSPTRRRRSAKRGSERSGSSPGLTLSDNMSRSLSSYAFSSQAKA